MSSLLDSLIYNQAPPSMAVGQYAAPDQQMTQASPASSVTGLPASTAKYEETDGKHKGVAGTARDVLGFLGDFLLTRLHMKPMYAPAQEDRKLHIAEQGFGVDPQQTADAISRVGSLNQTKADALRAQYTDDQRASAAAASVQEARTARLEAQKEAQRKSVIDRVANYNNGLSKLPPDKRAEAYANGKKLWGHSSAIASDPELAQRLNDLYPDDYDENTLTASIGQSVPVATQWSQALARDKAEANVKHQGVVENQGQQKIDETGRHHQVQEGQGAERIGISASRASGGGRPASVKNVQTYVGEDGYKYAQRSDGTVVKSPTKVRSVGKVAGAPPVGYKNKYGLSFTGGDPNNRSNWK